jgi:hypothetical protein
MANRVVQQNGDHSTTLKSGRFYRIVGIVNGEPSEQDVREAVLRWGMDPKGTAISWPGTWKEDKPRDWPSEEGLELERLAANEFAVRISGSFTGPTRTVGVDAPIPGEGTITIAGAWDCAAATREALAAREAEDGPETDDEKKTRTRVLWAAGAIFAGGMLLKFAGTRSGMKKEQGEYEKLERRANQARRAGRVRELLGSGHDPEGAKAIAQHEEWLESRAAEDGERHHRGEEG